jgi:hypothetical protein
MEFLPKQKTGKQKTYIKNPLDGVPHIVNIIRIDHAENR